MMTPYALSGLLQAEKAGYTIPNETAVQRGLDRLNKFINAMDAKQASDRIYCMSVYGLRRDIDPSWWKFIQEEAKGEGLSDQALALAVQLALEKNNKELAGKLTGLLRKRAKQANGLTWWTTARFSRWADDPLEITATALRALVLVDANDPLIPSVLAYLNSNKQGKHWHSTKDTALIVQAVCDYLVQQDVKLTDRARVVVRCNGGPAEEVVFAGQALTRSVVIPGDRLKKGANTVEFVEGTPGVMYRLILRHVQEGAEIDWKDSGIEVRRDFWLLDSKGKRVRALKAGDTVPRGSYLESVVTAARQDHSPMSYVLVENPRPSSCEFIPEDDARFEQAASGAVLREERETHLAWHYEQTPARIQTHCVLYAELPGEFVVAPAQVELMYHPEVRGHSGTFRFEVGE
jgi:uncharacterized protein YfaS (alpha-2-macroglobulin family)